MNHQFVFNMKHLLSFLLLVYDFNGIAAEQPYRIEKADLCQFFKLAITEIPWSENPDKLEYILCLSHIDDDISKSELNFQNIPIGLPESSCEDLNNIFSGEIYIPKRLKYFLEYICGQKDCCDIRVLSNEFHDNPEFNKMFYFGDLPYLPISLWERYISYCWDAIESLKTEKLLFFYDEYKNSETNNLVDFMDGRILGSLAAALHAFNHHEDFSQSQVIEFAQQKYKEITLLHQKRRIDFIEKVFTGFTNDPESFSLINKNNTQIESLTGSLDNLPLGQELPYERELLKNLIYTVIQHYHNKAAELLTDPSVNPELINETNDFFRGLLEKIQEETKDINLDEFEFINKKAAVFNYATSLSITLENKIDKSAGDTKSQQYLNLEKIITYTIFVLDFWSSAKDANEAQIIILEANTYD